MESPWDHENRWAVYPIEKIEAAIANLNEAIVLARNAQREAQAKKQQARAEQALREIQMRAEQTKREVTERDLDKMLCPGCRDCLPRDGSVEPYHMWLGGGNTEPCLATTERKAQIRQYFAKELLTDLQKAGI